MIRKMKLGRVTGLLAATTAIVSTVLLSSGVANAQPEQVPPPAASHALGKATACMINAPSGATVIDPRTHQRLGHVGWAFQEGGTGRWFFGATEANFSPPRPIVDKGGDTQSWMASAGNQNDMLAAFKNPGHFHSARYYTQWRCRTISNTAVGAALKAQHDGAASGYNVFWDNCLTKAVAILNAYGEGLAYPGASEGPQLLLRPPRLGRVGTQTPAVTTSGTGRAEDLHPTSASIRHRDGS